jgi:hypothetical protein
MAVASYGVLVHYPSGMSRVETLVGRVPTKAGDLVEIKGQPTGSWIAREDPKMEPEGAFEGKRYDLEVEVQHPPEG